MKARLMSECPLIIDPALMAPTVMGELEIVILDEMPDLRGPGMTVFAVSVHGG